MQIAENRTPHCRKRALLRSICAQPFEFCARVRYNISMSTYKIVTYGCQMNVHESEKIAGILRGMGMSESETDSADVVVFNTCCIRDNAERKAVGQIGRFKQLKKDNPDAVIAVVGCMTQQDGAGLALRKKFPFVDIVLGTNNTEKIGEYVRDAVSARKKTVEIDDDPKPAIAEGYPYYRTSGVNAWINIMYGCNNFCTYCVVPYVRGRERSRTRDAILREFEQALADGYKEVTLLGQNVNSYGNDRADGYGFAELLTDLAKYGGDHRIRFMTSHPKDMDEKVIDIVASSPNICNNIHLPIQSGSDKILKLMNRHYTRDDYLRIIDRIREKMPDCGITTDLMVGFPYEEEEDFEDTLDIVRRVGYSNAFTFVYSPRRGTPAASMPQVPAEVSKRRIMRLIAEQNAVTRRLSREYVGGVYRVLCEDVVEKNGVVSVCGRTESGRMVTFGGDGSLVGTLCDVKINRAQSAALFGEKV